MRTKLRPKCFQIVQNSNEFRKSRNLWMHRSIACGAYGKNLKKFRARCHARCLGAPPRAAAARARCPDAGIKPRPDPPRRRFAPRRVRPHFPPPRPAKSAAPGLAGRCPAAPRPATPHRTIGAEGGGREERKEEVAFPFHSQRHLPRVPVSSTPLPPRYNDVPL